MKNRLVPFLALLFLLLFAVGLAADTSEYFFKTVPITRVYPHRNGYRIVYRRSNLDLAVLYVPDDWFQYIPDAGSRGKGDLVMDNDPSFPYMSIFWKNAEFSHIRLYLHENKQHISWGDLDNPESFSDKFEIDTLDNLQF